MKQNEKQATRSHELVLTEMKWLNASIIEFLLFNNNVMLPVVGNGLNSAGQYPISPRGPQEQQQR